MKASTSRAGPPWSAKKRPHCAPTQASGGGQPINVLDPSLVISIQVAIQGLFPSRT